MKASPPPRQRADQPCPWSLLIVRPTSLRGRAQQHHFTTALRARLAANARHLVEQRYDWDAIGRRFVVLVEETAQARRPLSLVGS